jgi:hypothetical protein
VALAVGVAAIAAAPATGQGPPATEAAAGAAVALAQRGFWGPELGVARRPGGAGRLALAVAAGDYEGVLGVRVAATAQFLLTPAARAGVTPYAGLGLAWVGAGGVRGAGYLAAVAGLESAGGRRAGWYGELGLGGGVRLAVGRRWRRLPAGW